MSTTFLKHFDSITDPRIERCKKHNLLDILLLAFSAVLSGAEGWEDIEDFGHLKLDWLRQYRPFEEGIPKHDTIARVICRLKAEEIETAFQSWISSLVEMTGCDVIAIDGKTARRSFSTKERKNALHTVSAWSCQNQLVLGQTAVDAKTNEITAIPELLTMLDIENSIITLDAMGCQKKIAEQIISFESVLTAQRFWQDVNVTKSKIKAIKINGYSPENVNHLLSGNYPLYRVFNLTTWEGSAVENSHAQDLVSYLVEKVEKTRKDELLSAAKLKKAGWKFSDNELIGEPE